MARVIPLTPCDIAENMNLLKLFQEGADVHCIDNEGHKLAHWALVSPTMMLYYIEQNNLLLSQ